MGDFACSLFHSSSAFRFLWQRAVRIRGRRAIQARKARPVRKAPRVCRGFRELKVKLAFKGHKGRRVRPVRRAKKGTKGTWEQSVLPAPQALRDPLVLQGPPVQTR